MDFSGRARGIDASWGSFGKLMSKAVVGVIIVLFTLLVVLGISLLMAFPVKWAWNYVVPVVSKGMFTEIDFWQAFVGTFLCQTLFKGVSSSSGSSKRK